MTFRAENSFRDYYNISLWATLFPYFFILHNFILCPLGIWLYAHRIINNPEVKVCTFYIHTCKYINVHTHILQLPLQLARTIILLKVQPEIFHILLWSQNDSLLSRTNYIPTYFWFLSHFFLFWGFTLKFNLCNIGLYFYSFFITYLYYKI